MKFPKEQQPIKATPTAEELPSALELRAFNLLDAGNRNELAKNFPKLDKYTKDVLWLTWQDNKAQICTQCGHIVIAKTGICSLDSAHKFRAYHDGYESTGILFQ